MKDRYGFEQTKVTFYLLTDGNIIVCVNPLAYHSMKITSAVTTGGLLTALMVTKICEKVDFGVDGKMMFFFQDSVLPYNPGWPGAYYGDQAGLKLT